MFIRFTVGFAYVLLLLGIGLLGLGAHFMAGTVPNYAGSTHVKGIGASVTIDRDEYGVPHIAAHSDRDAYFGLGYAQAQDRLFQMEMLRRAGEGRLSEYMGKKTLLVDAWAHTIGFSRIARQMWQFSSPHTKEILNAYCDGINQFLSSHKNQLGFEFDALKIDPEPWKPEDAMVVGRLMAWEMNFSYWSDAAFGDIALGLDSAHLRSLFPNYPEEGATVLDGATPEMLAAKWETFADQAPVTPLSKTTTNSKSKINTAAHPAPQNVVRKTVARPTPTHSPATGPHANAPKAAPPKRPKLNLPKPIPIPPTPGQPKAMSSGGVKQFYTELQQVESELQSVLGSHGTGGGSNSFALAPSRTQSGGAVLENDTHLTLGVPARWYLVQMSSDEGLDVAGFCIPGLPAILAGRNQNISWGITNGMADESDFFIETPADSNGNGYLQNNTPRTFTTYVDSIRVRDSISTNPLNTLAYAVRMTVHGPLVSDIHPFRFLQSFMNNKGVGAIPDSSIFERKIPVSLTWNGEYVLGDEMGGFINIAKAKSMNEAREGLRDFATPCLNLCLADRSGGIAYQYIGRLPKRSGSEEDLLLPRQGNDPKQEWQGFIGLASLPSLQNPPRGYIVSANNPPMRSRPYPMSNEWETPARADRISELIEQSGKLDTGNIRTIITDVISPYDRHTVLPYLLTLYPDPHPVHLSPDSTSMYRLDSMQRFWKRDSIKQHSTGADSLIYALYIRDSIATRHTPDDTLHIPPVDKFTSLALDYVRNWDGGMRVDEVAPTIYAVFLNQLMQNTFKDELGDKKYREFIYVQNIPLRTLIHLLKDSANIWWDDVTTRGPVPETRDSIIKISFHQTLHILARTFGNDMRTWQWGRLHTLTYHHVFESAGPVVAQLVNIDAGPVGGGLTTVMQEGYYLWQPYQVRVGPSMRMIADMKSDTLLAILPTGNSESIFGDHYRDMMDLFDEGEYVAVSLTQKSNKWKHTELIP